MVKQQHKTIFPDEEDDENDWNGKPDFNAEDYEEENEEKVDSEEEIKK